MSGTYWGKLQQSRLSRRRALTTAAGIGAGAVALSLVGCGGGSDGNSGDLPQDKASLVYKPVDSTSQAKAGGTFRDFSNGDALHFDPLISNSLSGVTTPTAIYAYPRMLNFAMTKYPEDPDGSIEGDLVERFEVSTDKLQITFKLRPGLKWDSRAPTSSRVIDADDVVFSWNKYGRLNPSAAELSYNAERSPGAAVESVTATDATTVVFKLRQPDSTVLPLLAGTAHFYVMPRESDGGYDPRNEIRGYGPWILDEYQKSSFFAFRKNPEYRIKDRPFIDRWERPIVQEYATRLAQFRAGNIWTTVVANEDLLSTKSDVPDLLLSEADAFPNGGQYLTFGFEGNSIFKDQRVRQAVSMLLDREAFTDVIENRASFQAGGLEPQVGWNTILFAGWGPYTLDPSNASAFGNGAQYLPLEPNVTEAKRLLSAAGHPNGAEFELTYVGDGQYGTIYPRVAQVFAGMLTEGGMRANQNVLPYQTYYDNYFLGYVGSANKPGFNGMILRNGRSFPTAASQLQGQVHKDGSSFHGLTPNGLNAHQGDSQLNTMIERIRGEFDPEAQQRLCHELVRYYTTQAYSVSRPSVTKAFALQWPVIGNFGVDKAWTGTNTVYTRINWWIDNTKKPVA